MSARESLSRYAARRCGEQAHPRPDRRDRRRGRGSSSRRGRTDRKDRVSLHAASRSSRPRVAAATPRGLAGELRELVQKEDAAVRERRLAGAGTGASADDRGRRRGVVRGAERRPVDESRPAGSRPATEWMRVTSSACSIVSGGRMPGAGGRASSSPCRAGPQAGDCAGPPPPARARDGALLAAHIGEVGTARSVALVRRDDGARLEGAAQVGARLGEVLTGIGSIPAKAASGADSRGQMSGRGLPAAPPAATSAPGTGRTRPSSASSEGGVLSEPLRGNLVRRGKHRERDWSRTRPFLPQPRRRD